MYSFFKMNNNRQLGTNIKTLIMYHWHLLDLQKKTSGGKVRAYSLLEIIYLL